MVAHATRALATIRWSRAQVREFAGRFLSEPKAHVFFDPPARPMALQRFVAEGARRGLALDRRSRLLFSGSMFFMNGEAVKVDREASRILRRLADRRRIAGPIEAPRPFWQRVHAWYSGGFLHLAAKEAER